MNLEKIRDEFKSRVCEQIDLEPEGEGRYLVKTPFRFDDGDHFVITLKREGEHWILSDEASTLMHLSYWMDDKAVESGKRQEIMQGSLATYAVQNRDGELVISVGEGRFGDALFDFIQALTKVADLSFLSREIVVSTFMEDFRNFMKSHVPPERLEFDWYDEKHDPNHRYMVDCRVNSMKRPLLVYALPNDDKMKDATISLLNFERWKIKFKSLAIFEEQENVAPKPLARFTDVIGKTFSSLSEDNKPRIADFLNEAMQQP